VDPEAERYLIKAEASAMSRPPAGTREDQRDENHVLLRELAARRAETRRLRREAFRSRSLARWASLVIRDQSRGTFSGRELWNRHPHVRTGDQLSFGERSADIMRNAFGSWTFVGAFLAFMASWMILNTVLLGTGAFDKFPWILLNLMLSMMAGLQGALILIAAKRADRIQAEQATAHYEETRKLDALQTQNNEMTARIETATDLLAEIHRHVSALGTGAFPPDQGAGS